MQEGLIVEPTGIAPTCVADQSRLDLRSPGADHKKADSYSQDNQAQHRRQRDSLMLLFGGLDRTDVDYLLTRRVGETLIRQYQRSDYGKKYSNHDCRFHTCFPDAPVQARGGLRKHCLAALPLCSMI